MLLSSSLLQKHCCKHFFLGLYRNYQILCKIHPLHNQQEPTHSLSLRAKTGPHFPRQRCSFLIDISLIILVSVHYTLNVRSPRKQLVLFPESRSFLRLGKHQDSRETKLTGFLRNLTSSVLLSF